MKGLELAKLFFEECGQPRLDSCFPDWKEYISTGLCGEGSECFGFDDELSRDHDWGPGFCLWYPADLDAAKKSRLVALYQDLPDFFKGFLVKKVNPFLQYRIGPISSEQFYHGLLGTSDAPVTLTQWMTIPGSALAATVNGMLFHEAPGTFSAVRRKLQHGYPKDVLMKKLAACCMRIGQAGQYNYYRCLAREERVAASQALAIFTESTISAVYLLNNAYTPFYKWMHHGLPMLPLLGAQIHSLLDTLWEKHGTGSTFPMATGIVEEICHLLVLELKKQKLTDSSSDFLFDQGPAIQRHIQSQELRSLNVMEG